MQMRASHAHGTKRMEGGKDAVGWTTWTCVRRRRGSDGRGKRSTSHTTEMHSWWNRKPTSNHGTYLWSNYDETMLQENETTGGMEENMYGRNPTEELEEKHSTDVLDKMDVKFVVAPSGVESLSYTSYRALEQADVVFRDPGDATEDVHTVLQASAKVMVVTGEDGGAWAETAAQNASMGKRVVRLLSQGPHTAREEGWKKEWVEEVLSLQNMGMKAILLPWVDDTNLAQAASWTAQTHAQHVTVDWRGCNHSPLWSEEPQFRQQLEMCKGAETVYVHVSGKMGVAFAAEALLQRANKHPQQKALLVTLPRQSNNRAIRWCTAALQHIYAASTEMLEEEEAGDAILLLGDMVEATEELRTDSILGRMDPDITFGESNRAMDSRVGRMSDSKSEREDRGLVLVEEQVRGEVVHLRNEVAYLQRELRQRDEEVEALWDEAAAVLAHEVEKVQEEVVQREQEIIGLEDLVRDQSKSMDGIKSQVRMLLELSRRAMSGKDR